MVNPYLLLACGVGLVLAAVGGYHHGVTTAEDACIARAAEAAHAAAESARLDAEAESMRRAEESARMAASAAASREARLKGQINALKSAPRPDCLLPADRVRDLNDAIRAANQLAAPERVPDAMPVAAAAD
ncbi:hypothetical protein [Thauera humireducens]|uniref:hypothetical protein n=1 Tax=Thauera humireducens TaxID=1134435 RepID=UPI00311D38FA